VPVSEVQPLNLCLCTTSRALYPKPTRLFHTFPYIHVINEFIFSCKTTMQRKRRVPRSFDWTPVAPDTKRPLPDTRNSHTRIDLDQSGSSTSQTSYISAPASPTKILALPFDDDDINWNNEPAPPEINTTNYPFLDPAYVHFLDVNEPGPPRRKRTTEVKYISNLNSGSTNSHRLYKGRPLEKMVRRRPGQISAGTPSFRWAWGAGLGFGVWAVQFRTSKVEM
jgi:hypothetical protein